MRGYVAKRILLFIPTLFLVTTLVFLLLRIIPGDPARLLLSGEEGLQEYSEEDLIALQAELGTDKPLVQQYGIWVWGLVRLDFGESILLPPSRSGTTSRSGSPETLNSPSSHC